MKGRRLSAWALHGFKASLEMGEQQFNRHAVEMLLSHIEAQDEEIAEAKDRLMIERVTHLLNHSASSATDTARAMRQLIKS
ncbi:hypothetical protein VE23_25045 [Paenibacillus sp. D9]|uniref:hypothetical protein n=1 Tax=Paenibacillus sp. D9 TaxID=665792 RepID=UPI00061EEE22|nr:hypothetical protein [Paenibacillus sp. D9]KKC49562.1 hypothetical protein VE23_25045 [Paenibacillus sp. D9]